MASSNTSKVAAYMLLLLFMVQSVISQMSPQYFNIAEKKKVTVNATCGEGYIGQKHYFCKLVGYDTYLHTGSQATSTIKDGQVCIVLKKSIADHIIRVFFLYLTIQQIILAIGNKTSEKIIFQGLLY